MPGLGARAAIIGRGGSRRGKTPVNLLDLSQESFIELFEISDYFLERPGDIRAFCAHPGVVFQGLAYEFVPIQSKGFDLSTSGPSPRPTLIISNIGQSVSNLLATLKQPGFRLEGLLVTRRLTQRAYLDDGDRAGASVRELPQQSYRLERVASENKSSVQFVLETGFGLDAATLPGRTASRVCQWQYRGPQCGYTGGGFDDRNQPTADPDSDRCNKYISGCQVRFGEYTALPHGGFPGLGQQKI